MIGGIVATLGVVASLSLATGMVASRLTGCRFWPPGDRDWRWWTYVGLSGIATVALLGVGYVDWNTYVLPRPASLVAGAALLGVGLVGFLAATCDLGVEESGGMEGELRTGGFYRYTRNPQIVFLLIIVGGVVLTTNSLLVLLIGASMAVWFLSMPFAEEPWLRDEYGMEYDEYRRRVPRFVGVYTARALLGDSG